MPFMTDASTTSANYITWSARGKPVHGVRLTVPAAGRTLDRRGPPPARRHQAKLVRRQFAIHISIELPKQRERRFGEFVEIDFPRLVPIDQRPSARALYPRTGIN